MTDDQKAREHRAKCMGHQLGKDFFACALDDNKEQAEKIVGEFVKLSKDDAVCFLSTLYGGINTVARGVGISSADLKEVDR